MNQIPALAALLPERDAEGYLIEPGDWNEDVARALANEENIRLVDAFAKHTQFIVATTAPSNVVSRLLGAGVEPIVHESWGGEPIVLPGDPRQVLDPAALPALAARVGHDIVTSDPDEIPPPNDRQSNLTP